MTVGQSGDAIETLFLDLSVRTQKLESDIKAAIDKSKRQFEQGGDEMAKGMENSMSKMGGTVSAILQQMIMTLVHSGNPLQALEAGLYGVNGAANAAAASGSGFGAMLAGLTTPVTAVITGVTLLVTGLKSVMSFMSNTGELQSNLAARLDTLNVGLEVAARNAGVYIDKVREKMAQLQATGITTRESIESLMQFMSQNLPTENIDKLARSAQNLAVAYGKNSTETFNRFVYAIMTGNSEVLRLVGINKTATMMQTEYAESLGKTVKQLSDVERKEAVIAGIMKATNQYAGLYEKSMESLGKRIGSLPRYIEEGTVAIQRTWLPMIELSVDAIERFWKVFQSLFVEMRKVKDEAGNMKLVPDIDETGGQKMTDFAKSISSIFATIKDFAMPIIRTVIDAMKNIPQYAKIAMDIFAPFTGIVVGVVKALSIPWEQLNKIIVAVTGDVDWFKNGIVAAGQIIQIAVAGWVGMFTLLADAIDLVNKKMRGEEGGKTWDEMMVHQAEAVSQAIRDMQGIGTTARADVEDSVIVQQRKMYENITGEKATSKVGMRRGMGPLVMVDQDTEAYKEWLKVWQANYEKYVDGVGKIAAEKHEGIMPDTFLEWMKKQKFTDTGDDRAKKEQIAMMEELVAGGKEILDRAKEVASSAEKEFIKALENFDKSAKSALDQLKAGVAERISAIIAKAQERDLSIRQDAASRVEALDRDTGQKLEDNQVASQDRLKEIKKKHLEDMKRLEEDYRDNLEDAVQNRDARRVLQLMRDHAKDVRRAEQSQDKEVAQEKSSLEKRREAILKAADQRYNDIVANMNKLLVENENQANKEIAQVEDQYQKQRALMVTQQAKERALMQASYAEQLKMQKQALDAQILSMTKAWAAKNNIDEAMARNSLMVLQSYYGENVGSIDLLMDSYYTRLREKAIETRRILAAIEGTPIPQSADQSLDPSLTPAERYAAMKDQQLGYATGGITIANKPTKAIFGEAGAEMAAFIPMNDRVSLDKFFGGTQPAGANVSSMQVGIRIESDGVLSPAVEDRMYDKIADVFRAAIPNSTVRRQ